MIRISPLERGHLYKIAQLHLHNLPTDFSGKPGANLLQTYYTVISDKLGGCGFVALSDDHVIGYICGIWDPNLIRKDLIRSHWYKIIYYGILQIIVKPKILQTFLSRMIHKNKPDTRVRNGYELRPIVIAPDFRGTGAGGLLLKELVNDARKRGFSIIHLFTEPGNLQARNFYEKTGFSPNQTDNISERELIEYSRNI